MAIVCAPVLPTRSDDAPPPPYDRRWVAATWQEFWLRALRANGGIGMYFFYSKKEQASHIEAQKYRPQQVCPHGTHRVRFINVCRPDLPRTLGVVWGRVGLGLGFGFNIAQRCTSTHPPIRNALECLTTIEVPPPQGFF